jgi:L-fuculose-phosphate aldolase
MKYPNLREEIVACCRLMAAKGLVAGTEGNVSARDEDGTILMTPSGMNKGEIEPEMLVRLSLDGKVVEGELEPTSEKFMHLEFYRQRPGVGGVAHGHPIFCTAFAAAHQALPENILPELIATIGHVPLVPYGRPSSAKLAAALSPYCRKHNVFLLQNHGATAIGKNVREAYHRLEVVEAYAKTVWAAASLGGVKPLPRAAIDDLPSPSFP